MQTKFLNMREPDPIMARWVATERPTARLIERGAEALTDAELISVLLRRGTSTTSALDLARDLLTTAGSLRNALTNCADALNGEQSARLQVVQELARRVLREFMEHGDALSSPQATRDYLRLTLQGRDHEVFICVYLNSQNRVIATEELFRGTLTQTSVFPREIVKRALHFNAAAVIFAHNHPSGVAEPSRADEALTQTLKHTLATVDVKVLDHFVIGADCAMSFAERGIL